MSFAVVSLVRVIPLPQSGCWIPMSDITGVGCGIDRSVRSDLTCQVVDIIFDVADLQGR